MRIHYSDVDDVIAYKLKQKKKQLLLSFDAIDMQDGGAAAAASNKNHATNGTKRKKKRMKDAPVFQDPRFANSYVHIHKQIYIYTQNVTLHLYDNKHIANNAHHTFIYCMQ